MRPGAGSPERRRGRRSVRMKGRGARGRSREGRGGETQREDGPERLRGGSGAPGFRSEPWCQTPNRQCAGSRRNGRSARLGLLRRDRAALSSPPSGRPAPFPLPTESRARSFPYPLDRQVLSRRCGLPCEPQPAGVVSSIAPSANARGSSGPGVQPAHEPAAMVEMCAAVGPRQPRHVPIAERNPPSAHQLFCKRSPNRPPEPRPARSRPAPLPP